MCLLGQIAAFSPCYATVVDVGFYRGKHFKSSSEMIRISLFILDQPHLAYSVLGFKANLRGLVGLGLEHRGRAGSVLNTKHRGQGLTSNMSSAGLSTTGPVTVPRPDATIARMTMASADLGCC